MGDELSQSNYQTVELGDLGRIVTGKTPSTKAPEYFGGDIPFVTPSDMDGRKTISSTERYLTQDGASAVKSAIVPEGSVMVSCIGSDLGKVAFTGRTSVTNQQINTIIVDRDRFNAEYIYYDLSTRQNVLKTQGASGSAVPILNKGHFSKLHIKLPPLDIQAAIANILSALDDKIELNRQMNRTLEAMARAIFKAWFVDFGPVKAKAAGATSFRGMPQDVFDQLPAQLTESDLGPVPDGWEVGTLDDLVKDRRSRVTPSNETCSMPYVPIDCITSKSISLEQSKSGEEAKSSLIRFDEDDILFGAMRPYFHKVCLAPFSGTTRTTAFVLQPKQNDDLSFALFLLSEASTIDFATQHSVGSTIPYAKWENSLASMPIVYPDKSVRSAFHSIVGPFLDLTKRRYFENRMLAELRDTLLPKLISGEIRVPEALEGADGG